MKKTADFMTALFQSIVTFVVLFIIFLIFAVLDVNEADTINAISFLLIQPFLSAVFSLLTVLICFVVGMPIRFNNRINQWWKTKPSFPIVGLIMGLLLLLFAFNANVTEIKEVIINEEAVKKEVPNFAISITGWFLVAFSLLHFYPVSLKTLFRKQNTPVVG